MTRNHWKELFEVVGLVALVASLVFIGLQMQQDQRLARAEMGSGSLEFAATIDLVMIEPDVSGVWVKMLEQPQDLSSSEIVRLDGFLRAVRGVMLRECYLKFVGVFGECESVVGRLANEYFANDYAQMWWRHNNYTNPFGTVVAAINEIVTSVDSSGNRLSIDKLKDEL